MSQFIKGLTLKDLIYYASVLILIGITYGQVSENTDHRKDTNVHMTLERKEELFVTRKEYEQFREDVIDKIFEKLNSIDDRLNRRENK